jgi:hypothetical protein
MKTIEIPKEHIFTAVSVNGKISDSLKPIKVDDYCMVVDKSNRLKSNYYYDFKYNVILNNLFINLSNGEVAYIIASTKFIDKSIPVIKFMAKSKIYTENQVREAICQAFLLGLDRVKYTLELENKIIKLLKHEELPDVFNLEMEDGKLKTKSTSEGEIIKIII